MTESTNANADSDTVSRLEFGEKAELDSGETITVPEGAMVILEREQSESAPSFVPKSMNAPHCLFAYKSWGAIQVQNDCPAGFRVKVVLRYAGDTGCKYIQPHSRSNVGWNPVAPINRVVLC